MTNAFTAEISGTIPDDLMPNGYRRVAFYTCARVVYATAYLAGVDANLSGPLAGHPAPVSDAVHAAIDRVLASVGGAA